MISFLFGLYVFFLAIILSYNLLQLTPSRWQQSLYLLTANLKNEDEKPGKKTEEKEKGE